jgi:hypothetical protein
MLGSISDAERDFQVHTVSKMCDNPETLKLLSGSERYIRKTVTTNNNEESTQPQFLY